MKTSTKTFVFLGIAILALGCAGPKIKEAVTALKPKVDEIGAKVNDQKAILNPIADFDKQLADPKFGKDKKKDKAAMDKLAGDIEKTKGAIGQVLSLEGDLSPIADSLAILDKKAKGDAKTAVAGLNEQIASVRASFGEFKAATATA